MSTKRPKTRIAANAPNEAGHLSSAEQRAMELSGEVEHSTGKRREHLTQVAKNLGTKKRG